MSFSLRLFCFSVLLAGLAQAAGLEATLDRYEITVGMGSPAVIRSTLRNESSAAIYLTGVKVVLSPGASGDVYNPALLRERLRRLDAGQIWDGPLVEIRPSHRGPLLVKGLIRLSGGGTAESTGTLASIPIQLTIDDPRRESDGSYDRETVPSCDRSADRCCDPSEDLCFPMANGCVYVAEGYDRQQVCVNREAQKSYEHITDLRISADSAHIAYIASFECQSGSAQERCRRTVVVDRVERPGPGVATHLDLSPDGLHYAYIGRESCMLSFGEEHCTGASQPVLDGSKVGAFPVWYREAPPPAKSRDPA